MADQSHLDILQQGVEAWNSWREQNPSMQPDLSEADLVRKNLSEVDLSEADLSGANLSEADLSRASLKGANLSKAILNKVDLGDADLFSASLKGTILQEANLSGFYGTGDFSEADFSKAFLVRANLSGVDLSRVDLSGANLSEADLSRASLKGANLSKAILKEANLLNADFSWADLSEANLMHSALIKTNLTGATLTSSRIYGISAWSLTLEGTKQQNLNVSDEGEPTITVDNLEVAQFIYLLLNNEKIRQVIDTITSKVVLILGRFTEDRKVVLDAIRDELRQHDYSPILFDFEKPARQTLTETISTLAHMARFIIADVTQAKSIPHELQAIVPNLPSVPVQPLLLTSEREYSMFGDFRRYPWVLDTYYYDNLDAVLASVEEKVISPAEAKVRELAT